MAPAGGVLPRLSTPESLSSTIQRVGHRILEVTDSPPTRVLSPSCGTAASPGVGQTTCRVCKTPDIVSHCSARATMIYQSTPHRVFKIAELTRLIASQLALTSRKSALNLACVCRYLEEPALSMLWEMQHSFCTLLDVLPEETWKLERWPAEHGVRGLILLWRIEPLSLRPS